MISYELIEVEIGKNNSKPTATANSLDFYKHNIISYNTYSAVVPKLYTRSTAVYGSK